MKAFYYGGKILNFLTNHLMIIHLSSFLIRMTTFEDKLMNTQQFLLISWIISMEHLSESSAQFILKTWTVLHNYYVWQFNIKKSSLLCIPSWHQDMLKNIFFLNSKNLKTSYKKLCEILDGSSNQLKALMNKLDHFFWTISNILIQY